MATIVSQPREAASDRRVELFCTPGGPDIFRSVAFPTDVWNEDPFDVESIHSEARDGFRSLLDRAGADEPGKSARVLLLKGESGSGKTHLMRAFRAESHRLGRGYFSYMQMTSSTTHYGRFILQKLIDSLDKPYTRAGGVNDEITGLMRLSTAVFDSLTLSAEEAEGLRSGDLGREEFGALVERLAERALESPALRDVDLDMLRVMLAMQNSRRGVAYRAIGYLRGDALSEHDREWLGGACPIDVEQNSVAMIKRLADLMWATHRAALVICVDQFEEIVNATDAPDKFRRAVEGLLQVAEHVSSCVVVISCLENLYEFLASHLGRPALDRLERDPAPITLTTGRSWDDVQRVVVKHLQYFWDELDVPFDEQQPTFPLPDAELRRFINRRARDVLDFCREFRDAAIVRRDLPKDLGPKPDEGDAKPDRKELDQAVKVLAVAKLAEQWSDCLAEPVKLPPDDDAGMAKLLAQAIECVESELEGEHEFAAEREDNHLRVTRKQAGEVQRGGALIGVCTARPQGPKLGKQIDAVLEKFPSEDLRPIIVRCDAYQPKDKKAAITQKFRAVKELNGDFVTINNVDWRAMAAFEEFHGANADKPCYDDWLREMKPLSVIEPLRQILKLDALVAVEPPPTPSGKSNTKPGKPDEASNETTSGSQSPTDQGGVTPTPTGETETQRTEEDSTSGNDEGCDGGTSQAEDRTEETTGVGADGDSSPEPKPTPDPEPSQVVQSTSLHFGHSNDRYERRVELDPAMLKRHIAFLGTTGSGKTTAALNVVEQLLLQGVPVLMVDRKGDLSAYAESSRWSTPCDDPVLEARRRRLLNEVDTALFTPGHEDGRPIRMNVVPERVRELTTADRKQMAAHAASAFGSMMKLVDHGAKGERQAILRKAIELLSEEEAGITLESLGEFIGGCDVKLVNAVKGYDVRQFRTLARELQTLRINSESLFPTDGAPLDGDFLLGRGKHQRPGKTRLSIINTKFLGGAASIQFWIAQLVMELTRWTSRNPSKTLQAAVFFDEADLYLPAIGKPAAKEPLEGLLKRARSTGLAVLLGTQSPGDFDYKCRENINTWLIGAVRQKTALDKLKPLVANSPGDWLGAITQQEMGEFCLVSEAATSKIRSNRNVLKTEQLGEDEILAAARAGASERA